MRKTHRGKWIPYLRAHWILYVLILVPLVMLIIFKYIPMYGAQIAFRDYSPVKGVLGSPWVGLKHIIKFFESQQFVQLIRNTLTISIYSLIGFPLTLILALMLNYLTSIRFRKTIQMVSYAPHFISMVVLCGMVLQFLSLRGGMLNDIIELVGIEPVNFMAKKEYFYPIYILSGIWKEVGYGSIIFIAALSSVSPELHEAAIVDGASIWKRIWHVDIPGVLPTFCILLILRCGSLLSVGFEKVLLLQNNLNVSVSEVISTYTYKIAMVAAVPRYSYAAAIGLFTSIINLILLITVNRISRRLSGNSLW